MNINTDNLIKALTLLLAGFIIVFVVLILLIVIITIYGKLIQAAQGASEKRKQKKKKVVIETQPVVTTAPAVFGDKPDSGEIPGEIIAVIAAAVDAVYGSGARTRIRSVKRSRPARSAWGKAGVADNTRPF